MKQRKVALALFYDNGNILIQDRRDMSKYGEEYGFFGGGIEQEETPEQAIIREIREELNIEFKNYKFFREYNYIIKEFNKKIFSWIFIAKMPDIRKIKCGEGKPVLIKFEESFKLKMLPGDIEILKYAYEAINRKPYKA